MANNALGRLRKGREFDRVYAEGTVVNGPLFVVRAVPNGLEQARWGFAVGRKLAPRAVVRNRTRRRLRDAARRVEAPVGWDIVVTARGRLLDAEFVAIERELGRAASRLGDPTP
ncbi:MAG: ribonuclease P protein component [Dehalococcoidia bacterium]|nr:ribonuclease P protein component [Dehalococcoidia bacterium]